MGDWQDDENVGKDDRQNNRNVHQRLAKALALSTFVGAALVIICTVIASASMAIYFIQFAKSPISAADGVALWVSYASAIGPMLQTVVSASTLIVAAWLGYRLNTELEERRQADQAAATALQAADAEAREQRRAKDETNRELTRLSEFMVNGDFYLNVTQPSWQIATDWFNLDGPAGDEFRAKLFASSLNFPWRPMRAGWKAGDLPGRMSGIRMGRNTRTTWCWPYGQGSGRTSSSFRRRRLSVPTASESSS